MRKDKDARFLTSGVGFAGTPACTVLSQQVSPGDRLLLCTDGVSDALGEDRLAALLASDGTAPILAYDIATEAAGTGFDNATAVVLFMMEDEGDAEGREPFEGEGGAAL